MDVASVKTSPYSMDTIKTKIMRPALTSHFVCEFNPPPSVINWLDQKQSAFDKELSGKNPFRYDGELISLSCCDATLPGSTLYTHDVTDYTGVMEKIPYRRVYDDRADFTFYVDHNYDIIKFFEFWIQYVVDEQYAPQVSGGLNNDSYAYRMNYPDGDEKGSGYGYRTEISISKFERHYGGVEGDTDDSNKSPKSLYYTYLRAYPTSIMSMPVSYESSQLLKCTVSFSYIRYVISSKPLSKIASPNPTPTEQQATQTPGPQGLVIAPFRGTPFTSVNGRPFSEVPR